MIKGVWLLLAILIMPVIAGFSFDLGAVAERRMELSSLRSTALEMSLSGVDEARRSALVLKTWADALATKP